MALIQRYATDFTSDVAVHRHRRDGSSIDNELAQIQRSDQEEKKRYLHSLNDRLEHLLGQLDGLEGNNKKLRDELNGLIHHWGFDNDRERFLKELQGLTRHLSEERRRKVILHAETKLFNEQTQLTDRVTAIFVDVVNFYRDQEQIFIELIPQFGRGIPSNSTSIENQSKSSENDGR